MEIYKRINKLIDGKSEKTAKEIFKKSLETYNKSLDFEAKIRQMIISRLDDLFNNLSDHNFMVLNNMEDVSEEEADEIESIFMSYRNIIAGTEWDAEDVFTQVDCDSGLFEEVSCNKYDGGHRIVLIKRVYVEATSGNIIEPKYYEYYGIRR